MFRFTIRDVLWLTVVVAMGVGWWADHRFLHGRWFQSACRATAMEAVLTDEGWTVEQGLPYQISIEKPGHKPYVWGPATARADDEN